MITKSLGEQLPEAHKVAAATVQDQQVPLITSRQRTILSLLYGSDDGVMSSGVSLK